MARRTARPKPTRRIDLPASTRACPECGGPLRAAYKTHRAAIAPDGDARSGRRVRRRRDRRCPRFGKPRRPEREGRIIPPRHESGLDVIAAIGRLRSSCRGPAQEGGPRHPPDRARARGPRRPGRQAESRALRRGAFGVDRRRPPAAGGPRPEARRATLGDRRGPGPGGAKEGPPRGPTRLRAAPAKGPEATAAAWPDVRSACERVRRAASILADEAGLDAAGVRGRHEGPIAEMTRDAGDAGALREAIGHSLKVTRGYWPGPFARYDMAELPLESTAVDHRRRSITARGWSAGGACGEKLARADDAKPLPPRIPRRRGASTCAGRRK